MNTTKYQYSNKYFSRSIIVLGIYQHLLFTTKTHQNVIQYNLHTPIFKLNPSWILFHECQKISILGTNTFLTMNVQLKLLEFINLFLPYTRMSLNITNTIFTSLNPIFKLNPSWILLHEYHKISILGINTFFTMDTQLQLLEYINIYFYYVPECHLI